MTPNAQLHVAYGAQVRSVAAAHVNSERRPKCCGGFRERHRRHRERNRGEAARGTTPAAAVYYVASDA